MFTVGVGFSNQLVANGTIPMSETDQQLDKVICAIEE